MSFNPNAKTFNAANALLLVEASEIAYSTEAAAPELQIPQGRRRRGREVG
jgi:hypothetical protein